MNTLSSLYDTCPGIVEFHDQICMNSSNHNVIVTTTILNESQLTLAMITLRIKYYPTVESSCKLSYVYIGPSLLFYLSTRTSIIACLAFYLAKCNVSNTF